MDKSPPLTKIRFARTSNLAAACYCPQERSIAIEGVHPALNPVSVIERERLPATSHDDRTFHLRPATATNLVAGPLMLVKRTVSTPVSAGLGATELASCPIEARRRPAISATSVSGCPAINVMAPL